MPGDIDSIDLVTGIHRDGRHGVVGVGHTDDGWLVLGAANDPVMLPAEAAAEVLDKIRRHLSASRTH